MIQSNQNEQIIKVGNWVAARLNKFESFLTFVFLLVMGLHIGTKLNVNVFLVLTLLTLANLYFLNAFSVTDDENTGGLKAFLYKLISVCCSISVIGILFRILHWSGYEIMLPISCIALILSLAGILYLKSKKRDGKIFDLRMIIRIVTIVAVGLIMLLMSNEPLKEAIV